MSILIVSESSDIHANVVQHALTTHGISTTRLASDRLPREQTLSHLFIDGDELSRVNGQEASNFETVWLRRRGQPKNFEDCLDSVDEQISKQEVGEFWKHCQFALAPGARQINRLSAKLRAQSKIYQLRVAQHVGLKIPKTIISNDAAEVIRFAQQLGTLAFKSFSPVHWDAPSGKINTSTNALFTTKVSCAQVMDHSASISRAPAIFQELVPAAREYRVTVFGNQCITATVESTHQYSSLSDWRAGPHSSLKVTPSDIPEALKILLFKFMDVAELGFGTFDILETGDREYVFLEVNEAGQFLWIEDRNPDIQILKPFCDYLVGNSAWSGPLALAEVAKTVRPSRTSQHA
ncbi:hypothetical protein NYO99_17130 [Pelomonas sp. UHG3]|uniref:Uncharacterized protein n=1 Tax=Roseateles hydrophilus TaxID=2975054 RepID=A0ACC6CE34_9BURK|nr:hypothetical protein [Pelomonas sp. UHG3]MCY4746703.1 hypothetical protein [Pelomonas sp. UHG3]